MTVSWINFFGVSLLRRYGYSLYALYVIPPPHGFSHASFHRTEWSEARTVQDVQLRMLRRGLLRGQRPFSLFRSYSRMPCGERRLKAVRESQEAAALSA